MITCESISMSLVAETLGEKSCEIEEELSRKLQQILQKDELTVQDLLEFQNVSQTWSIFRQTESNIARVGYDLYKSVIQNIR